MESVERLPIDNEQMILDCYATIVRATGNTGSGYLFFWEPRDIERLVATHVVAEAGVADERLEQAYEQMQAADDVSPDSVKRRYDAELERLIGAHDLQDIVDEIVTALTTDRLDEAAL